MAECGYSSKRFFCKREAQSIYAFMFPCNGRGGSQSSAASDLHVYTSGATELALALAPVLDSYARLHRCACATIGATRRSRESRHTLPRHTGTQ